MSALSLGRRSRLLLAVLFSVALISRTVASVILPNAEQDGYSYAENIARLTQQFQSGHLQSSDLFGFWFPLFQVVSAVANSWIHDPIVAGKIINVVCGAVSIVFVFVLTCELTGNIFFSALTFVIILLDPLHILYSAACMTDVPHGCVVLVSLWWAMRRRWLGAAVFAAIAESIRIESWALILALPLLQWMCDRRVSMVAIAILFFPPLIWFGLSYATTGHPLAYFVERARYHAEYIQFHPARAGFNWGVIRGDLDYFLLGAGRFIFAGAIAAGLIGWARRIRSGEKYDCRLLAPIVYGGAMLALVIGAYLTKAQPVLLPRYGLTFFAIGLPLFAWALQWCQDQFRLPLAKATILTAVLIGCVADFYKQLPTIWKVRQDYLAHQQVATALVTNIRQSPAASRCFSDDVAVRVISHLPPGRFLRSAVVPESARTEHGTFLDYLRTENVDYLIFFPTEDSLPVKFFPELGHKDPANNGSFEPISYAHSSFGPDIWLYRVR